jgi:MFS transporter
VRLAGQFSDGVFQASLAGAVLFNPEHEARAADIAAGFAVLLLPYSLIGPFAGVLLDRWWRQRVLMVANLVRAVAVIGVGVEIAGGLRGQPLYVSALAVVSVNRFVLSALSAALPRVVDESVLVTANALSTTSGSIATTTGAAAALLLRIPLGGANPAYAGMAIASALPYLFASLTARGFERRALGPDEREREARETARAVLRGLVQGGAHILELRPVLYGLSAITVYRFCYGVTTVCTLLLYRNYFHASGVLRSGLSGLVQVTIFIALGAGLAAFVTPAASRRLGLVGWPVLLFGVAAVVVVAFGLPYQLALVLPGAFGLAFAAQGVKICVDTTVQRYVEDGFRGRVFTIYDTLFNVSFVAAAVVTALVVPESGHAPVSNIVLAGAYALTGALYLRVSSRPVGSSEPGSSAAGPAEPDSAEPDSAGTGPPPSTDCAANHERNSASARSAPSGPDSIRKDSK